MDSRMDAKTLEKTVIKVADSSDSFPKDKHVRTLLVYSQSSYQFQQVCNQILDKMKKGDLAIQMKYLVTLYRMMTDGPNDAATDRMFNIMWLDDVDRLIRFQQRSVYTEAMTKFNALLRNKIKLHTRQKSIPGSMDPDEF